MPPGLNVRFLYSLLMMWVSKLECLSLTRLYRLVVYLYLVGLLLVPLVVKNVSHLLQLSLSNNCYLRQ